MKCLAHITGNPEGHDWELVPQEYADNLQHGRDKWESILWACPCSEFRWTSYADWEERESLKDPHKDASPTGKPQQMVAMENRPDQGESTAAGHIRP